MLPCGSMLLRCCDGMTIIAVLAVLLFSTADLSEGPAVKVEAVGSIPHVPMMQIKRSELLKAAEARVCRATTCTRDGQVKTRVWSQL